MTPDVTSLCSKPFFFFTVQMKIVRQHLFDWQSEIVSIHCPLHRYDRRIARLKQLIFSTQASNDTGKSLKKMHSEYCVDVAERGKVCSDSNAVCVSVPCHKVLRLLLKSAQPLERRIQLSSIRAARAQRASQCVASLLTFSHFVRRYETRPLQHILLP
jgi:transcriptional regulator of met regulon